MTTETMTPDEALLWLAGLETCNSTGKVPVLDLREPCKMHTFQQNISTRQTVGPCRTCQGRNWVPKQGEAALHHAMHKDGWQMNVIWKPAYPPHLPRAYRRVVFARPNHTASAYYVEGDDSNAWLAAVKAMKVLLATEGSLWFTG